MERVSTLLKDKSQGALHPLLQPACDYQFHQHDMIVNVGAVYRTICPKKVGGIVEKTSCVRKSHSCLSLTVSLLQPATRESLKFQAVEVRADWSLKQAARNTVVI
eukprot:4325870-Amphidinium_carterae.1